MPKPEPLNTSEDPSLWDENSEAIAQFSNRGSWRQLPNNNNKAFASSSCNQISTVLHNALKMPNFSPVKSLTNAILGSKMGFQTRVQSEFVEDILPPEDWRGISDTSNSWDDLESAFETEREVALEDDCIIE